MTQQPAPPATAPPDTSAAASAFAPAAPAAASVVSPVVSAVDPAVDPAAAPATAPAAAPAAAPTAPTAPTAAVPVTRNSAESPVAPAASNRLKRFRFKEAPDLLLLKSMNVVSGHLAEWGAREGKHAEALRLFLRAAPSDWFSVYQKPTTKGLGDRLRRILAERREQVKADEAASGIIEEYGERETLLDDMLLEIKKKDEADRAAKNETQQKEKRLLEAGEEIRENAIRRRTRDRTTPSPSPPRDRRSADSDDDTLEMLKKDMDSRRKNDATRLELEQRKMALEEKRMDREEARFTETQDSVRRRLILDEKKGEVEIEERKQSIAERAKMIDVLTALAQKLG